MKKIYLARDYKIVLVACSLILFISASGLAQYAEDPEAPGTGLQTDSTSLVLKGTSGMTWNALSNGSDYYIYYTWSGATVDCDCDKRIDFDFKNNGKAAGSWNSVPTSYSGSGYRYGMGPSQKGVFTFNAPYSGHNYFIICEVNCSGRWYSTGSLTRYTSSIKSPTNVVASDDESDTYIKVTWSGQTHIPQAYHGYKIFRDGIEVHSQYNSSSKTWYDYDVNPNESHNYTVQTYTNSWGGHSSWAPGDFGKTFYLAPTSTPSKTNVNIAWASPKDIGADKVKIDRFDGTSTISLDVVDVNQTNYIDNTGIPGYEYTYIITPLDDDDVITFASSEVTGYIQPNGRISGEVKTLSGTGVPDVIVCAIRQDDIPQGGTDTMYCDTTDVTGFYEIKDIYYYTEAEFLIVPEKDEHGFNPGNATRTLDETTKSYTINFTDTSSFTITGQITQVFEGDTCYVPGAEILVDDLFKGTVTDSEGNYSLTVDRSGTYTIAPRIENHSFSPASQTFNVTYDVHNVDFEDTTMFLLQGDVEGSCDIYIGQADLRIYSKDNTAACFDTTITTEEGTGHYEIMLPSREYYIKLEKFYPEDPNNVNATEVETYFQTEEVDLSMGDVEKNLIYRTSPSIEISGFDLKGCGSYDGIPIVEQGQIHQIQIDVVESFGDETCLTDTGYVVINNGLVNGATKVDTIILENGSAIYNLIAGDPNIIAPHLKQLEIIANVEGQIDQYATDVLVVGNRPREKTFISVSPEIPFTILRDPPGDASYSFLSKGTTNETTLSFLSQESGSVKIWDELKAGTKFEAGIGVSVETEVWGSIRASMEIGASVRNQNEFALTITNVEDFSTSGNQDITGQEGDVFVGASMNLIYALTDIIEYNEDECTVDQSVDIIMGNDGFNTTFMYTDNHIRNVLIPQLEQLRNLYAEQASDSAKLYDNQIKVWQQSLNLNVEQKKNSRFIENRSFSAGAQYQASQEVSKSKIGSIEFSMFVEDQIAIEAGLEVGGVGFSGGVEANFRVDIGASKTDVVTSTTKTGYVLNDDDVGDFFSVDILEDGIYGTPVFNLASGRSKCPWEPGTQPREGVQIQSDAFTQFVDDPSGEAVFRLNLGNTSQSDEDFIYNLVFLQESNPDGAAVTLGGSPVQGGILTPYSIAAGSSIDATVTIKRGPLAYDYHNLQFMLLSSCSDKQIADTVGLTVHFQSTCSSLTLTRPYQNWLVNSLSNSILGLRMEEYDSESINFLNLQYSPAGTNNWTTDVTFDSLSTEDYTEYEWALPDIADGQYDIRMVIECDDGYNYSNVLTGIIDRTAPQLFGIPQPADGYLDNGDILSVAFNENILCDALNNSSSVKLMNLTKSIEYPVSVGCSENSVILIPEIEDEVVMDTFEVSIMNLADNYGNIRPDTISWTFIVRGDSSFVVEEDADTDGDGIPNFEDNCPYSNNPDQEDLDGDGIGDVCDDDIDGDGVLNIADNCQFIANPDQADADSNLVGDACEATFDGDGDGVSNAEDNCPYTANPDQADMDGDGIGDVCDNDIDGDAVINTKDNCAVTSNPDQADDDGNGTGNACQSSTGIETISKNSFMLMQNQPNPFTDFTTIQYMVPVESEVLIKIYTVIGEEVFIAKETASQGLQEVIWNVKDQANGIYFYSITAKSKNGETLFFDTKKMMLQR